MEFRSGFVAVVGRPNVGKSTLLNQLVGQKVAIMSDKPQTTRNTIRCIVTSEDAQVVFIDTPGIHKPKHKLGERMVEAAKSSLSQVDAVLFVVEAHGGLGAGDEFIIEYLKGIKTPVFLVINKIDLVNKDEILPLIVKFEQKMKFKEIIPISAIENENTDRLMKVLIEYMPEGPQYYPPDMVTDHPERFVIAELIREKVLHNTRDEIPHAIAVDIEEIKQRKEDTIYVAANIYVERDSQKGIIVGKKGSMLKLTGQQARADIENLLGSKVFLDLWVKVKKDWRNKEGSLRNFGYGNDQI